MLEVVVTDEQDVIPVDEALERLIVRAAAAAYEEESKTGRELPSAAEVSVLLVSNEEIRHLNQQYRGIDQPTDVLSFAMLEGERFPTDEDMPVPLGDIILSLERARQQAQEYGHSFEREVAFLTVHGMCHLLGYDHMEPEEQRTMRQMEEKILDGLGYRRD